MQRRELLKGIAASTLAAAGVEGVEPVVHTGEKPLLVELRVERHLSDEERANVFASWRRLTEGTALEGVPFVVHQGGDLAIHSPLTEKQLDAIADRVVEKLRGEKNSRAEAYRRAYEAGVWSSDDIRAFEGGA